MNYISEKGSAIYWRPRKSPDRQLVPISVQSKTSISFDLVFFQTKLALILAYTISVLLSDKPFIINGEDKNEKS